MARLTALSVRVVFNSRAEETLEVDAEVTGARGRAAAPAGASVGKHEAVAFPPGGASEAIARFAEYRPRLIGLEAADIEALTHVLRSVDGTPNYGRIGGATAYAITLAVAEAEAVATRRPLYAVLAPDAKAILPRPLGNVLGGGKHARGSAPDIQEFLALPYGAPTIADAIHANIQVHRTVLQLLQSRDPSFTGGRGDEGAWAPKLSNGEALDIVARATERVSSELGFGVALGIDVAASSLWDPQLGRYRYTTDQRNRTPGEQLDYISALTRDYGLRYVEDPFHEDDYDSFTALSRRHPDILITGDDLFVTNSQRLLAGARLGAGNAAILKVNQAGALGDALAFARAAHQHDYRLITSHRSGETTDAHITHLAVATRSLLLKAGVVGGERVAKLNELLRLAEQGIVTVAPLTGA